jgi:signal transduction histidine kinase
MKSFQEETGLRVSLSTFAAVEQVNRDKRTVLYRVAQEALNNATRHAQASRVDVVIQKVKGTVRMKIADNGKGFRAEHRVHIGKNKRLGLLGMKERLEMVGGSCHVTSALGKGTIVQVQIPIDDDRARGRKARHRAGSI